MAFGLPVEGTRGPYVGDHLTPVRTCPPDRLDGPAVVITEGGVAIATVGEGVGDVGEDGPDFEPMPETIRPSVPMSDVDEKIAGRLVTTPDGVLLGAVDPEALTSKTVT